MRGSDNPLPSLLINEAATDGSDFGNPAADYRRLFLGEDGALHLKDSAGAITDIGGSVAEIVDIPTAEMDDSLVLAPDGAGGVEFRAETGGSGLTWTLDVDNPLTSASNTTSDRGTWTIDTTLKEAGTDGGHNRCIYTGVALAHGAFFIVEAEVKIPTTFTYSGIFACGSAASGGYSFRINTGNTLQAERDGVSSQGTVAYTHEAAGTWQTLRMVVIGDAMFGYVDGVLKYEGYGFGHAQNNSSARLYVGVVSWGSTAAYFRNLKGWSADLNLP